MTEQELINLALEALDDAMEFMDDENSPWCAFYCGKAWAYLNATGVVTEENPELEALKAERDAAIADLKSSMGDTESWLIHEGYGHSAQDEDSEDYCGEYCANVGTDACKWDGDEDWSCRNFKWRGVQKEAKE